jgi:hypothetical protein
VRNGWLVSDGRTLVAVYAGQAGNDAANGRFVVVRQNLVFGVESQDVVPAGHTGAVSLTRVPLGAPSRPPHSARILRSSPRAVSGACSASRPTR